MEEFTKSAPHFRQSSLHREVSTHIREDWAAAIDLFGRSHKQTSASRRLTPPRCRDSSLSLSLGISKQQFDAVVFMTRSSSRPLRAHPIYGAPLRDQETREFAMSGEFEVFRCSGFAMRSRIRNKVARKPGIRTLRERTCATLLLKTGMTRSMRFPQFLTIRREQKTAIRDGYYKEYCRLTNETSNAEKQQNSPNSDTVRYAGVSACPTLVLVMNALTFFDSARNQKLPNDSSQPAKQLRE